MRKCVQNVASVSKKANVSLTPYHSRRSMIGNLCIPLYSLPLYYAWRRKTHDLEFQHYHSIASARGKNVEVPKGPSNNNDAFDDADVEKVSSVNKDEYYLDNDEDLEKFSFDEYKKMYDSKPMHRVFVGGIIFTSVCGLGSDMGYLPRSAIAGSFSLVFLAICFVNFVLDGSFLRKRRGLRRTRRNTAYLYTCCTTLMAAINALTMLRNASQKIAGELMTSILISIFSVLLIFLWETMAFKAATTETAGPLMFPLYFVIDITQTYLFLAVPFMGGEFWMMLLSQEIMGAFRNCGGYEMALWLGQYMVGLERPFPLNDLHLLEELITIAAVDTVAEALAAFSFFCFLAGAKIVGTNNIACLFEPGNEECSEKVANLGEMAVTLGIVVVSRVFWFLAERIMFRKCVEQVSKSNSSKTVLGKSVRRIKRRLSLIKRTVSGRGINLSHLSDKSYTNKEALSDAKAYILDSIQEDAESWGVAHFSNLCDSTVFMYKAKSKIASCPWTKEELTFRASIILKNCTVEDVIKSDLDDEGTKKNAGDKSEILDAGDLTTLERERVLYQYKSSPFGVMDTDSITIDKVEYLGKGEALLLGVPGSWEGKEEKKGVFRNRGFVYGIHYKDCSPAGVQEGEEERSEERCNEFVPP